MSIVKNGNGCVNASPLLTMASSAIIEDEMATNHFEGNRRNLLATNASDVQAI